ncbi:hypothetical protein C0J52_27154 [Blattella germanica]|nr:hypothetical protein C0J52_27154 [Blattella germanica]
MFLTAVLHASHVSSLDEVMAGDPAALASYIEHPMSETETIFEPEKCRSIFLDDIYYPKTLMKKNFPRNTTLNDQSSYNLVSPYALLNSNFQKRMFPPTSQYQTNRFSHMPLNHLNFDEVMSHPTTFQHLGTPYAYSTFFPFTGFHSNIQQNGIAASVYGTRGWVSLRERKQTFCDKFTSPLQT